MDFAVSPTLAGLLAIKEGEHLDAELNLADLAVQVAESLGEKKKAAQALLGRVTGVQNVMDILLRIGCFLPLDSTVRDIATTGHLCKLLSRKEIYERLHDWRAVGLPNTLFDSLSWKERNEFFKEGVCHTSEPDLFQVSAVLEMLAWESSVIGTTDA
jgi:hypothetical protein